MALVDEKPDLNGVNGEIGAVSARIAGTKNEKGRAGHALATKPLSSGFREYNFKIGSSRPTETIHNYVCP